MFNPFLPKREKYDDMPLISECASGVLAMSGIPIVSIRTENMTPLEAAILMEFVKVAAEDFADYLKRSDGAKMLADLGIHI